MILADTVSPAGARLTTMLLRYPRFIHPELLTHRAFSRSSESSRAVNTVKRSRLSTYTPAVIGRDGRGMLAACNLSGWRLALARFGWRVGVAGSHVSAWVMRRAGAHKQHCNRPLDWCAYIEVIVTGDGQAWDNFFRLRCHPAAQPEMQTLAYDAEAAYHTSAPRSGSYHVPYDIGPEYTLEDRMKASAGYCAGISYLSHGEAPVAQAFAIAGKLQSANPRHDGPFEHQALACRDPDQCNANLHGWVSQRHLMETAA